MPDLLFGINNSKDKLKLLIEEYEIYRKDLLSEKLATSLSEGAWSLADWVFAEQTKESDKGKFRIDLFSQCPSLLIMHDIANVSKHKVLDRPKASIKRAHKHSGAFSQAFSKEFDISCLIIEMEDGTKTYFEEEIENVISFWKTYIK